MPDKTPEEIAAEKLAAEEAAKAGQTDAQKLAAALADVEKWKGHARTWEDRAKENATKAASFDDLEEKNKTELQREKDRADAAEKLVNDQKARDEAAKLRTEVAKAKGFEERKVPESALRGNTREELEAHADEILALLPVVPTTTDTDGQGKQGLVIGEGEMSVEDIVKAATGSN